MCRINLHSFLLPFITMQIYCTDSSEINNFRIISRNEWGADSPSSEISNIELPVKVVVIIHTATAFCNNQIECSRIIKNMQHEHFKKNFDDIAYNFLIGGDGQIYEGRGWDKIGAHSKSFNNLTYGIAFIGNYMDVEPTKKQLDALKLLIENGIELNKVYSDYELYGHRQLRPTLSPGDKLYNIIKTWKHWTETMNL